MFSTLYDNKSDNLDQITQFLEKDNLPKLIQEETDNLTRPITIKDIESITHNLLKQNTMPRWGHC